MMALNSEEAFSHLIDLYKNPDNTAKPQVAMTMAKIIFLNLSSRLAAAHVAEGEYAVFEFQSADMFKVGDEIGGAPFVFGSTRCYKGSEKKSVQINVLSPSMSFAKAKLVVAPWQDADLEDLAV